MTKRKNDKFVYDDNGNKVGIMLTKSHFERIIEELEDFADYKTIKKLSGKKSKTVPFEEVLRNIARHK